MYVYTEYSHKKCSHDTSTIAHDLRKIAQTHTHTANIYVYIYMHMYMYMYIQPIAFGVSLVHSQI